MRTYATIRGTFWTRGSGKKLKGDHVARELALYLMTCSQGTACGIFYINLPTIAYDMGETEEVIREALGRIKEIVEYDEDEDLCWVPNTAREQIGETMKERDKRRPKLIKELEQFGSHEFVSAFFEKYADAYGIQKPHSMPLLENEEGASKGHPELQEAPSTASAQLSIRTEQDLRTPIPSDPLPEKVISELARGYATTSGAIRAAVKECVDYWTLGGGAGTRRTRAGWLKTVRTNIKKKHESGDLKRRNTSECGAELGFGPA